jgi:UDP-3-O-[3-hydroxymyristoyl] glucosamine N-acyltransferase
MSATLGQLAVRFGLELRGDPGLAIDTVATLADAGPGTVAFYANSRYRGQLRSTRASAVVLEARSVADCPVASLVAANSYAAYARIAAFLVPAGARATGIHPSAVVLPGATLGPDVAIGAHTYVGPEVRLGAGVVVGPGCVLDGDIEIGEGSRLVARATLVGRVRMGRRCLLHPGVVLGADGFGFARDRDGWVKVPQIGGVVLQDEVEIGANTTVDRGAIGDTVLEEGVKLDNQIQIGHNVRIGALTAIAACVGVAGSTTIGKRCLIGGGAGFAGHIVIADDVVVLGYAMVTHSLKAPGTYGSGQPVLEATAWRRTVGRLKRLDSLYDRVRELERQLGAPDTPEAEDAPDDEPE